MQTQRFFEIMRAVIQPFESRYNVYVVDGHPFSVSECLACLGGSLYTFMEPLSNTLIENGIDLKRVAETLNKGKAWNVAWCNDGKYLFIQSCNNHEPGQFISLLDVLEAAFQQL